MRGALEKVTAFWAVLGGIVLLCIVAVTVTNVAAFALDRVAGWFGGNVSGLPGYEDFVRLTVACAVPMFLPWCQTQRGHLAVDLFLSKAPLSFGRLMDRISLILMALAASFLAYWMVFGMQETQADGALSRVLGWEEWPFYIPGIISLLLWALVAFVQIFSVRVLNFLDKLALAVMTLGAAYLTYRVAMAILPLYADDGAGIGLNDFTFARLGCAVLALVACGSLAQLCGWRGFGSSEDDERISLFSSGPRS